MAYSLKIRSGEVFYIGAIAVRFERKPDTGKFYVHIDAPEDTQVTPPQRGLQPSLAGKDRI